jgi:phosphoglycerol transferase MdoB-like AlkP superfamily enzyme
MADHILFETLAAEIKSFPRPFQLSILTLSFHDPYNIPDERFALYGDTIPDYKMLNCFYYSDWAVGQFVRQIKEQPVFDSTIFVFTSDHCAHQSPRYPLSPEKFHIPLLIYSPRLLGDTAVMVTASASQVDILPTLIGLTGINTTQYSWGRNLLDLSPDDSGLAVIVSGKKLGLIEGTQLYFHWVGISESLYDLNETPYLENNLMEIYPGRAGEMARYLNSYIQLADYLSRGDRKISETFQQ